MEFFSFSIFKGIKTTTNYLTFFNMMKKINLSLLLLLISAISTLGQNNSIDFDGQNDRIFVNSLANSVSETLYLGVHRHKRLSNRMHTVIEEAKRCLR